jgi:hypothetical protein
MITPGISLKQRGLQVGRQGRDNSSNGLDASPRRSNDHNVSLGFCQASRRAFSIAKLDAEHPVSLLFLADISRM